MNPTAERFADALRANSQAYHERRIDHDVFHARQGATWDAIDAAGVHEEVLTLLRNGRN